MIEPAASYPYMVKLAEHGGKRDKQEEPKKIIRRCRNQAALLSKGLRVCRKATRGKLGKAGRALFLPGLEIEIQHMNLGTNLKQP